MQKFRAQYAEVLSFLKSFNKIPFDKIISQGETDWRYVIEIKEQRYQGKVDLWFRDGHQVWLIDYRMGTIRDAKKTLENLETSAWAMKQMGLINVQKERVSDHSGTLFSSTTNSTTNFVVSGGINPASIAAVSLAWIPT